MTDYELSAVQLEEGSVEQCGNVPVTVSDDPELLAKLRKVLELLGKDDPTTTRVMACCVSLPNFYK